MRVTTHALRPLAFATGLVVVGVVSLVAVDAQNGDPNVIDACYNGSGSLYLVGEPGLRDNCNRNHTPVGWNREGPPGPAGEKGDKGDKGDTGDAGADVSPWAGYEVVTGTSANGLADLFFARAFCPTGKVVINGGFETFGISSGDNPVQRTNRPFFNGGVGWLVTIELATAKVWGLQAFAICVNGP